MTDFAKGVFQSLIAASLIAAGTWLAATQVSTEIILNYTVQVLKVGTKKVWYLRLINNSDVAFDKLELHTPDQGVQLAEFDPPNKDIGADNTWKGDLLRHTELRAIFVLDSTARDFSEETLNDLLTVKYQKRDENTGELVWDEVPIQQGDTRTFTRVIYAVLLFLAPLGAAGIVYFCWHRINRYRRSRAGDLGDDEEDGAASAEEAAAQQQAENDVHPTRGFQPERPSGDG